MALLCINSNRNKMASIKLSVVVPCYNEKARLSDGFLHYYTYLKKQKYAWELIFVNDGSSDNTLELIENCAKKDKSIKVVSYKKNHGKGYAIIQGIKSAKGQYILFTDIDHSVPIDSINNFFPYFEQGYKVVIGSRRVKGAQILVHQKPIREYLGRGFTLLVNLLIIWGVRDATCGFKAFENKTAQKIFGLINVYDWAFDAEILYICKKLKIPFAQAPVKWSDVTGSRVKLKRDVFNSFIGLIKIRLNGLSGKYPA